MNQNATFLGDKQLSTHSFTESTTVKRIEHDSILEVLTVTFVNGRTYRYQNVPLSVFNQFVEAPSAGKYFAANIRKLYTYKQVED